MRSSGPIPTQQGRSPAAGLNQSCPPPHQRVVGQVSATNVRPLVGPLRRREVSREAHFLLLETWPGAFPSRGPAFPLRPPSGRVQPRHPARAAARGWGRRASSAPSCPAGWRWPGLLPHPPPSPSSLALVTSGKGPARPHPPPPSAAGGRSAAGRASPGGCAVSRPWQRAAALRKLLTQRVAWRPASDVSLEPGRPRRGGEGEAPARAAVRVRASGPVGAVGAALQRSCSAAAARAPVTHGASRSRCPRLPAAADSSESCARPGWLGGARSRKTPREEAGTRAGTAAGKPHGWQLPEPPAARSAASGCRLDHPPPLPTPWFPVPGEREKERESLQPGMQFPPWCRRAVPRLRQWLGCYPRSLVFVPLPPPRLKTCRSIREEQSMHQHQGLGSFLPGLPLTPALSRELHRGCGRHLLAPSLAPELSCH